jgi:hypothetical protein
MNKPKEKKMREKKLPSSQNQSENQKLPPYPLNSYQDVADLTGKVINGLLNRGELAGIERQNGHAIFVGMGYLTNALRESHGGRVTMSVYLQDVHKHRINLENVPVDQVDRFLQGTPEIQMEVLKQIEDSGHLVNAEVKPVIVGPPKRAVVNTELIAEMSGLDKTEIKDLLKDEVDGEIIFDAEKPIHDWRAVLGGEHRYCVKCGAQRQTLNEEDMTSLCSEEWNLV